MNVNFNPTIGRWRLKYRLAAIAAMMVFLITLASGLPAHGQVTDLSKIGLPQEVSGTHQDGQNGQDKLEKPLSPYREVEDES